MSPQLHVGQELHKSCRQRHINPKNKFVKEETEVAKDRKRSRSGFSFRTDCLFCEKWILQYRVINVSAYSSDW